MLWLCLPLLAFAVGVLVGRLSVRRWRRDRVAWAQRRLQLVVLSLELKSLRSKVVCTHDRRTPPAQRRLVRKLPTHQGTTGGVSDQNDSKLFSVLNPS